MCLLGWNLFLELPHFEPNDYHCSKGVHFIAEYFVSGSGLLLLNILFDYDQFPKDTRT